MVGVAQHAMRTGAAHRVGSHRFHRARRTHRHEGRRLDRAMRAIDPASARIPTGRARFKAERRHACLASGDSKQASP